MSKINLSTRIVIQKKRESGYSYRKIAAALGISKSGIHKEIQKYSLRDGQYSAEQADFYSQQIRSKIRKKRRKYSIYKLMSEVNYYLRQGRSPYDISIRLKNDYRHDKNMHISHETIYNIIFSYKDMEGAMAQDWYKNLFTKNKKRHVRGHLSSTRRKKHYFRSIRCLNKKTPVQLHSSIKEVVKKENGIWQIDTAYLKTGFIAVAVEQNSKKILAEFMHNLKAETMSIALRNMFSDVEDIKAIICDRGSENKYFKNWQRMLNTKVYACDAGKPYQKGLVESSIRLLRQSFPRQYTPDKDIKIKLDQKVKKINTMYRKSLNGKTAQTFFLKTQTVHFRLYL